MMNFVTIHRCECETHCGGETCHTRGVRGGYRERGGLGGTSV